VSDEQDHIDRFLSEQDLPGVDLDVEGIVDRINGLRRRFHTMAEETLSEQGLAEASKESLIAGALTKDEQRQLNALLRRLMREFEQRAS